MTPGWEHLGVTALDGADPFLSVKLMSIINPTANLGAVNFSGKTASELVTNLKANGAHLDAFLSVFGVWGSWATQVTTRKLRVSQPGVNSSQVIHTLTYPHHLFDPERKQPCLQKESEQSANRPPPVMDLGGCCLSQRRHWVGDVLLARKTQRETFPVAQSSSMHTGMFQDTLLISLGLSILSFFFSSFL